MELKFDGYKFFESYSTSKDDFLVKIDTLKSYYKSKTEPPTIQIKIGGTKRTRFLRKRINVSPEILVDIHEGSVWIFIPIKKIKNIIL